MSSMQVNAAATVSAAVTRLEYLLRAPCENNDLKQKFEELHSKLSVLQQFLVSKTKLGNLGEEDLATLDFCRKVIPLAYDVENAADSHALRKAMAVTKERPQVGGFRTIFRRYSGSCATGGLEEGDDNNSLDDLDDFNTSLEKLITDFDCEKVNQHAAAIDGPEREEASSSGGGAKKNYLPAVSHQLELDTREYFIGKEDEREELVATLLGEDTDASFSRIAIVGKGGSGKTALARKVYRDPKVLRHFEARAWVFVGPNYSARDILTAILGSLSPDAIKKKNMGVMKLLQRLNKVQNGRRCLIVLDDVWDTESWETMQFAFVKNPTTKILITTRSTAVAEHLNGKIHIIRPLTTEESWELFTRLSGLEASISDTREEKIGKQIIERSAGLPIAITEAAQILKGKILSDRVEIGEIDPQMYDDESQHGRSEMLSIYLTLSYDSLPLHEKPCFLYLGQFPLDQAILSEKVYLLWIAEGLISTKDPEKSSIDTAEEYLRYLVDISLVKVQNEEVSDTRSTRLESLQRYSLIRDLCLSEVKQEEFFGVVDFTQGSPLTSSRVAVYLPSGPTDGNDIGLHDPDLDVKKIRSLLFFAKDQCRSEFWPRNILDLKDFVWIRVLDFNGIDFRYTDLPKSMEKLIYLRYLGFGECYLYEFPLSWCGFPSLETLYLRVKKSFNRLIIPNALRKLSNLKHLYFPEEFVTESEDKLKLDTLTGLEILDNFHAGMCDADDLQQFQNLQIFSATADGRNAMDFKKIICFIDGHKHLRHSSITFREFDCYSKERRYLLNKMLECNALRALHLEGYLKRVTETLLKAVNLAELVFDGSEFREDPMPKLGLLPNLRSLTLCNDAFVGKKISCPAYSFEKLKSLQICNLQYLEEWELLQPGFLSLLTVLQPMPSRGAMPSLTFLTIEKCGRLSTIPSTMMKVRVLEMKIRSMPTAFKQTIRNMVAQELEKGNIGVTVTFDGL